MYINNLISILQKYSLIFSVLIFVFLSLVFYPKTYITVDEASYVHNAENILNHELRSSCSGFRGETKVDLESDHCINKYNIGTSFFIIPAILISKSAVFFATTITFVLSILIFYKLLKIYKINTFWIYFYTFFPAFIYYSRTILSEVFSLFLILTLVYLIELFLKKQRHIFIVLIAAVSSLIVYVRYIHLIFVILILFSYLIKYYKHLNLNPKKFIDYFSTFTISVLPFVLCLLLINDYLYLSPFRSGYYFSGEELNFDIKNSVFLLPRYLISLMLIYPLMFSFAAKSKFNQRNIFLIPFTVIMLLYSFFPGNNIAFEGRILDLILGIRFLVPFIPLILILYFEKLDIYLKTKNGKKLAVLLIIIFIINTVILSYLHQEFLISEI